jgi:hypothetical protein
MLKDAIRRRFAFLIASSTSHSKTFATPDRARLAGRVSGSGEDRISLWDGASSTDLLLLAHMC